MRYQPVVSPNPALFLIFMASKRKRLRNRRPLKPENLEPGNAVGRNVCLDTLRGLAIVLMIVDHAAGILLTIPIDYSTIRFGTRLSMPLFAILMGYLLNSKAVDSTAPWQERFPIKRLAQILASAVATGVLYFSWYGSLDILSSLAICYLVFLLLRDRFVFLVAALVLYKFDVTRQVLDYPLTIVICLVAQGMILRRLGLGPAAFSALALTVIGIGTVGKPSLLVLLFALPATLLVGLAGQKIGLSHPWLSFLGRYPLTVYVVQYYIIFGIAWLQS